MKFINTSLMRWRPMRKWGIRIKKDDKNRDKMEMKRDKQFTCQPVPCLVHQSLEQLLQMWGCYLKLDNVLQYLRYLPKIKFSLKKHMRFEYTPHRRPYNRIPVSLLRQHMEAGMSLNLYYSNYSMTSHRKTFSDLVTLTFERWPWYSNLT